MTLQSTGLPLVYPGILTSGGSAPALGSATSLDASGEYAAYVFIAAEAMVISHVGVKLATATNTPDLDIRIETVTAASGVPSGTLWATDTNIVATGLTTTFGLHALTASATIAKGECFAVKLVWQTATDVATINSISGITANLGGPYLVTNVSGSDVKSHTGGVDLVLGSNSTTFYKVRSFLPVASVAQNSFNNTNGNRRGVLFQLPFTAQCVGLRYYTGTAVGDFNAAIYNSDGSAEVSNSSTAFEGDRFAATGFGISEVYFDNAVTLTAGTNYRAVIEPSSATNCNMYVATLPGADYRSAWPGGTNYHYVTFASSAWDDTKTSEVPFMDLLLKQFDDGAGAAGARIIGG